MRIRIFNIIFMLLIIPVNLALSQDIPGIFSNISLKIDTSMFTFSRDQVEFLGEPHLAFRSEMTDPVCEVEISLRVGIDAEKLHLLPSKDFSLLDSLLKLDRYKLRFKVQFWDLFNTDFLKFTFEVPDTGANYTGIYEVHLLPYTSTFLKIYPTNDELYIGEEKVFELVTNHVENIQPNNDWVEGDGINYRIRKTFNQVQLHVVPTRLGSQAVSVPVSLRKPVLDESGKPVFKLQPIQYTFNVRQSRLQFLNIDRREITLDEATSSQGIEIQLDNSRLLVMQKTYRVENQEQPGGNLIAEIFTKNRLTNNKVLCILRVYNYHRKSNGYLYIKDGDTPLFITNTDITPRTTVNKVSILRQGNWSENLQVHPGEIIDVKIEGVGLHKARFSFEDLTDVSTDSTLRSEDLALYKFRIPMDISASKLNLFDYAEPVGITLTVNEFQEPRPFDFIWMDVRDERIKISELPSTVLVEDNMPNLIFGSNPDMIDSPDKLYGKQYLKIELTITGRRNELIEVKTIDDIVICPGINSQRSAFYNSTDCGSSQFDLNRYIRKKSHELEIWSQIKIRVSHNKEKYGGAGFSKEFDLILQKDYSFDIEVSFPAGLITVSKPAEGSDERLGQLTGISVAMIAQFTFYHPEKINTPRPFKIGAGFLALNTFNFSDDDTNRDIGLVVLGSLYPTTKDVKLTFPLYIGGGYQLKNQKWFFLVGPGIRIRL